ncbi:MAG: cytochrome P450 [Candidatus Sericytochromatia bacterium]
MFGGDTRIAPAPPGPSGLAALRYQAAMLRDPLPTLGALRHKYGDIVRMRLSRNHTFFLLNRPEYVEHVLVRRQDRYVKGVIYRPLKAFLGDGLLTAEGPVWQRHRRLVQPVFNHSHVQSFAPAIVDATRRRIAQWSPGNIIDVAVEMRTLTMDVIGRVLFGTDLTGDAASVGGAEMRLQRSIVVHAAAILPRFVSPERLRALATWTVPGLGRAAYTLDSVVARIIDTRMFAPHQEPSDLLDLLLAAGPDEQPLSRTEILDQVKTLVLAGHETTTNALTWTLTLLSRNPAAYERVLSEVDDVLGGRHPQAPDVDALPWTQAVVSEALRLYPPVCYLVRDAVADDDILGIPVSAGDTIGISPYLLHRNPEFWSEPDRFDPQRFVSQSASTRRRYAYLPFGGGHRICLGAGLARLELTLVLAVLSQSVRIDLVPTAALRARADVTLHPAGPVAAKVTPARSTRRSTAVLT